MKKTFSDWLAHCRAHGIDPEGSDAGRRAAIFMFGESNADELLREAKQAQVAYKGSPAMARAHGLAVFARLADEARKGKATRDPQAAATSTAADYWARHHVLTWKDSQ